MKQKSFLTTFYKHLCCLLVTVTFGVSFCTQSQEKEAKAVNSNSSNYIVNNYDHLSGLPSSEANSVLAAKDGFIWIGSYGGLTRYDGKEFKCYTKNEFNVTGIRYLCENSDGVLYIGTNNDGLYKYENGKFDEIYTNDNNHVPSIRTLVCDLNNNIYVGTYEGLFVLKNNKVHKINNTNITGTVYGLSVGSDNVVWGCDGSGSAFGVLDEQQVYYASPSDLGIPDNRIYSTGAKDNIVYLGTNASELLLLEFTLLDSYSNPSVTKLSTDSLSSINKLKFDKDNNLWMATSTGCGYFDSSFLLNQSKETTSITSANDLDFDFQNNLWIASATIGVTQIINSSFYHLNGIEKITNKPVNCVQYYNGNFYIGTDEGLIITDENFKEVTIPELTSISNLKIKHINIDSLNRLWLSTYSDHSLIYIDNDFNIHSVPNLSSSSQSIRSTLILENGEIMVASDDGLFIVTADGQSYVSVSEFSSQVILSLCQMNDGTVLIGTNGGGLFSIKEGVIKPILTINNKTLGIILRLYSEGDIVWVADSSNLYLYKNSELIKIDISIISFSSILDIFVHNDKLYLLENDGIYQMNKQNALDNNISEYIQYGSNQGMIGDILANTFSLVKNGLLYICTNKGLSYINLSLINNNKTIPGIHINKISYEIEGKKYSFTNFKSNLVIPSNAIKIKIEISCLNYSLENRAVYYQLKGFENSVNTIIEKGTKEIDYSSLKGGNYEFILFTKDVDNKIVNKISLKFEKELFWYEKTINIVLLSIAGLIVIAGLIFGAAIYRIKKAEKEKLKYKEITNQALLTIAHTIDAKDQYTNGHSIRVAEYSVQIAKRLGFNNEQLEQVHYIALLHDIGKIGVPDAILNKPGKLTDEEYGQIKQHTTIGGKILRDFTVLDHIADGAIGHHERFDGKGYPNGKVGEDNPLIARIISVADTYDAMSSTRPYRTGMSPEFCIEQLEQGKGTQFDPKLAQIMIDIIKENKNK